MSLHPVGGTPVTHRSWLVRLSATLACWALACGPAPLPPRAPESPAARSEALPRDVVARAARPLHAIAGTRELRGPELWDTLAAERAICFGESHPSPEHHYAQLQALSELAPRAETAGRKLAVGFEMFQHPYQSALDRFVQGAVEEEAFLVESEFSKRWGYDFSLYRPLLETAQKFRLPALALNAPKELTRKIGRGGLAALEPAERSALPELVLDDAEHKAYFDAAMREHPMPPGGPKLEDMYAAQVVWDETMADTAARWLKAGGESAQIILFAGSGHCHESAIPARLTRRVGLPVLSVTPVLASELESFAHRSRYDLLIVIDDR